MMIYNKSKNISISKHIINPTIENAQPVTKIIRRHPIPHLIIACPPAIAPDPLHPAQ